MRRAQGRYLTDGASAFFGEVDPVRRQKMRHTKEELIPRKWKLL